MNTELEDLFQQVISYWPVILSTSTKTLYTNGGANIPEINAAHEREFAVSKIFERNLRLAEREKNNVDKN